MRTQQTVVSLTFDGFIGNLSLTGLFHYIQGVGDGVYFMVQRQCSLDSRPNLEHS